MRLVVSCDKCGMRKQYDRDAVLRACGDRTLAHLLDEIVARSGCPKANSWSVYDRCGAKYDELLALAGGRQEGGGNPYRKAKGLLLRCPPECSDYFVVGGAIFGGKRCSSLSKAMHRAVV